MYSDCHVRGGRPTKPLRSQEQFLVQLCAPLPEAAVGICMCEMAPGVPFSFPLVKVPAPCSSSSTITQGKPYGSALLKLVKALDSYWCHIKRGRGITLINQGFITDMLSI